MGWVVAHFARRSMRGGTGTGFLPYGGTPLLLQISAVALICIFNANCALLSFYAVWRSYMLLTVYGCCYRDVEIILLQQ
jgi:hypothetical protein